MYSMGSLPPPVSVTDGMVVATACPRVSNSKVPILRKEESIRWTWRVVEKKRMRKKEKEGERREETQEGE